MTSPQAPRSTNGRRWWISVSVIVLVAVVTVIVLFITARHGSSAAVTVGPATATSEVDSLREFSSESVTPSVSRSAARGGASSSSTSPVLVSSSGGPAPPHDSQAHEVAAALSALRTDPASLVAAQAGSDVKAQAGEAIPKGSKVTADEKSWAPDGIGGGVMKVAVSPPGQPPITYAVIMVKEGSQWKVLATAPVTK